MRCGSAMGNGGGWTRWGVAGLCRLRAELLELRRAGCEVDLLAHVLLQEGFHLRMQRDRAIERRIAAGHNVKSQLDGYGITVDLNYANNDIPTPLQKTNKMHTGVGRLLIITRSAGTASTSQPPRPASPSTQPHPTDR